MPDISLAKGRSNARKKALQALYQWALSGNDLNEIEVQFHNEQDMAKVDQDYFHVLLHQIPANVEKLDALVQPLMELKGQSVDPVEQAILRLSSFELLERLDVPYRVVIKEAIQLAKLFGADQSHKFVNGVLDKIAQEHRKLEINAEKKA